MSFSLLTFPYLVICPPARLSLPPSTAGTLSILQFLHPPPPPPPPPPSYVSQSIRPHPNCFTSVLLLHPWPSRHTFADGCVSGWILRYDITCSDRRSSINQHNRFRFEAFWSAATSLQARACEPGQHERRQRVSVLISAPDAHEPAYLRACERRGCGVESGVTGAEGRGGGEKLPWCRPCRTRWPWPCRPPQRRPHWAAGTAGTSPLISPRAPSLPAPPPLGKLQFGIAPPAHCSTPSAHSVLRRYRIYAISSWSHPFSPLPPFIYPSLRSLHQAFGPLAAFLPCGLLPTRPVFPTSARLPSQAQPIIARSSRRAPVLP